MLNFAASAGISSASARVVAPEMRLAYAWGGTTSPGEAIAALTNPGRTQVSRPSPQENGAQVTRRSRVENLGLTALVVAMVAVGGIGWLLQLEPQIEVDASRLADVPTRIGQWASSDIPLDGRVEAILRADFHLQRAYQAPAGQLVWLYVGYYGTARGGRPEHTPRGCYTGAGWGIESSRTVDISQDGSLRANEYLVTRGGESRLVHFWFRSHRRTGLLGGLDQSLDRLMGRLLEGRGDGMLVRVSTRIVDGDTVSARGRLLSFASRIDPVLGDHWPIEHRDG